MQRLVRIAVTIVTFLFGGLTQAVAQPIAISLSSGSGVKGLSVLLNLSVVSDPSQPPASLQWNFSLPADLGFIAASTGPTAQASGKTVTCGGTSGGSYTCIATGVNKNTIQDGVVATLLFSVSPTTVNPTAAINLSGALAAGPGATTLGVGATGNTVTIQSGTASTLNITTPSLAESQVSVAYAQTLSATGGSTPYTWSILSGALPAGLSLSASGAITGKATAAGVFVFIVQVTDGAKSTKTQAYIITVSTTPVPPPQVLNAASLQPSISPDSWLSIIGGGLAATTRSAVASDVVGGVLPTSLNGVGVTVNGETAAVSYVSPTQINALIPRDIPTGPGEVKITGLTNVTAPVNVVISPVSPAFFTWLPKYVSATHMDGSLAVKAGEFPGVTTKPVMPGEIVLLFGTGFGPTAPLAPLGQITPASPAYNVITPPKVTIGGVVAAFMSASLVPGYAGLYQIQVVVPPSLPNGDVAVIATVGGVSSPTGVLLTILWASSGSG